MQTLIFSTTSKKAEVIFSDGKSQSFEEVPTVKVRPEGFYEIMQKDMFEDKQYPVYRLPIASTIMEIKRV